MRNYHSLFASFFILIAKNTQRHQFDYQYPTKIKPKIFTCFYMKCVGMSEIVFNSTNRHISKIFA
ncbi:hypothetical protein HMPREF1393_00775 [Helicobacter pylori GAM103Bi]|nr:hypothetical protein HMPREF1393_00775 [Helicobacter pylori GAM103Bi]